MRSRQARFHATVLLAGSILLSGLAFVPADAAAQGTACSEGGTVLWSQLPEQNWAATQSLLEEIASVADATNDSAPAELSLTPEVPLSVDPEAARLLDAPDPTGTAQAAPEKPGICFTDLDPSCVRDPGSSSSPTLTHFERGRSREDDIAVKPQPVTEAREYPRSFSNVGPDGVSARPSRPPAR